MANKSSEQNHANLPPAVINRQTVLRAISEKPKCGMKHLFQVLVSGKQGGALTKVKKVRDELVKDGHVKLNGYNHDLTEHGHAAAQESAQTLQ